MSGRIDADMLYDSVTVYFKKLFKENRFRELKYLRIYPFLSALLNKDLYEKETILKEEIRRINNILRGKENYSYDFWMTLSPYEMNQFHKIWSEYCEKGIISLKDSEWLQEERSNLMLHTKTVEDICRERLLILLSGLPTVDDFYFYNLLYAQEVGKNILCEEIQRLLELLAGERPVHFMLRYVNGFLVSML